MRTVKFAVVEFFEVTDESVTPYKSLFSRTLVSGVSDIQSAEKLRVSFITPNKISNNIQTISYVSLS